MTHLNSTISFQEQKSRGRTENFRKAIWGIFKMSNVPLTDREVMDILDEEDVNNVRPEITRLKQDGLIQEKLKKRCGYTGKTVRACEISSGTYIPKTKFKKDLFL